MDDSDERVATCEYDGLPALDAAAAAARRWSRSDRGATLRPAVSRVPSIEKTVGNQGTGVVYGSDGSGDITGIEAGHPLTRRVGPCPMFVLRTPHAVRGGVSRAGRHEHYLWGGMGVSPVNWRLIETTNHAESAGDYSYSDADVLNQFVYRLGGVGVSPAGYIDEPLVYDRNEDPNEDDSCLDVDDGEDADGDSSRYFYHQDANFRVVALTDESAGVVERYRYTAYGEPTVFGGENASGNELANALFVSSVGNPFMHQGLFRDTDIGSYQNRYRQYDAKWGRFLQRDPVGYADGLSLYEYIVSGPFAWTDAAGLKLKVSGSKVKRARIEKILQKLCHRARVDPDTGWVSLAPEEKESDDEGEDCSSRPTTQPDKPTAGCAMLKRIIDKQDKVVIITTTKSTRMGKTDSPGEFEPYPSDPNRVIIRILLKKKVTYTDAKGNIITTGVWHVLLDELTHADRWIGGRYVGAHSSANDENREEAGQLAETNVVLEEMGYPGRVGHGGGP